MAYRLPAHLHRNRHGVLYFRLSVPADIRLLVGQREIYRSLNTASVREAADSAQALRIAFWAYFGELRALIMSEDEKTLSAVDINRLNELMRVTKDKLRLRDKIDELEEKLFEQHLETERSRKRHARELEIAIQAKGGGVVIGVGKPFEKAVAEYLESQRKATTRKTYSGRLKHAQAYFGAGKDIRRIEQADLSAYARQVHKDIPNSTTAEFYITTLCGMLNRFRIQEGWGPQLTTKTLIRKKETPDAHDRDPFTLDQLAVVFRNAAKYRVTHPHRYWATVGCAFLGCRIEEFAQVDLLADFHQDAASGVWYFDFNAKPDRDGVVRKSMKNKASWRCVPIHSALVKHGIIDYLQAQINAGYSRPFESGWKPLKETCKWSHSGTNWGSAELEKLKAGGAISDSGDKLSYFHSMRHTFTKSLKSARVDKEAAEAATGHTYAGSERERYLGLKADPVQLSRECIEPGLQELAQLLNRV